jgi:hypothetical protein
LTLKKTTDNWSYQWNKLAPWDKDDFENDDFKGTACFKKFLPLEPADYAGRTVVVWCGGSGREAYHISKFRPALLIVNDIGDQIYRINGLIDESIELLLIKSDMVDHPLHPSIADLSICDHALQHIMDRDKAFSALVDVLKTPGTAAICVYSYEHNFLMTHIIEPLKRILHKLPLNFQRAISFVGALLIFLLIKLFYLPAKIFLPERVCRRLPLFDHMIFWSKGKFALIELSCFDLIHAPVSYHFKEHEVRRLAQTAGLQIEKLINTYGTTWSMTAKR